MIRVMLVDDHVLMREGIRQLLEFDGSIEVIAEASNGEECFEKLKKSLPDIVLLDINMPGMNGIEVLNSIRKMKLPIKVLMLTVHNETEYLLKAMDIGADGYILKDSESAELKRAIKTIIDGNIYVQPTLVPAYNSRMIERDSDREKVDLLSKREMQVLLYIANGLTNKEIADNLKISERTVKNHVSNIFKKIDVFDRTQAAVFAIKNDLIKLF